MIFLHCICLYVLTFLRNGHWLDPPNSSPGLDSPAMLLYFLVPRLLAWTPRIKGRQTALDTPRGWAHVQSSHVLPCSRKTKPFSRTPCPWKESWHVLGGSISCRASKLFPWWDVPCCITELREPRKCHRISCCQYTGHVSVHGNKYSTRLEHSHFHGCLCVYRKLSSKGRFKSQGVC